MPCVGGLAASLLAGRKIGCDAVQLFTGSPRQWTVPALEEEAIEAFHVARRDADIRFTVAHDSYLINLAASDPEILERSRKAFSRELERAAALGIPWVVTHLGAHLESGEEEGLVRLTESIQLELDRSDRLSTGIALETTAGQGTSLGWRFEHIARIFDVIGDHPRLSVCLDTCHVFAAGYDLRTPEAYHATVAEFDRVIGLRRLSVIHANDARKPLGSRVDRHEHIGEGEIGIEAFAQLVRDARLRHVPIIIETPDSETMHEVNLGRLRRLAAGGDLGLRVRVRLFGPYSDLAQSGLEMELPAGATVADLGRALVARDSRLTGLDQRCRSAVNERLVRPDAPLREGDEVAFLPPAAIA